MKFSLFGIGEDVFGACYLCLALWSGLALNDAGPVICSEYVLLAIVLEPFRNHNNGDTVFRYCLRV